MSEEPEEEPGAEVVPIRPPAVPAVPDDTTHDTGATQREE